MDQFVAHVQKTKGYYGLKSHIVSRAGLQSRSLG